MRRMLFEVLLTIWNKFDDVIELRIPKKIKLNDYVILSDIFPQILR